MSGEPLCSCHLHAFTHNPPCDAGHQCLFVCKGSASNGCSFLRSLPPHCLSNQSRQQSWSRHNLYNLWRRSLGELAKETNFTRTQKTLFQQRWAAKSLVRAYHGDFINEKSFKRWYLPTTLPDVRSRRRVAGDDTLDLNKWAKQDKVVEKGTKVLQEDAENAQLAPVGSMMFAEVERRIDVFIFRACMAHSVYEARRMVVHGDVLLNGQKVCLPGWSISLLLTTPSCHSIKTPTHASHQETWCP